MASSRLVFAVARDGVLPFSGWIGRVTTDGQPRNAVTVIYIVAALLLCTIIPSQVAFTSLVSAGAVPTIAAYAVIPLLRLFCTPNAFQHSHFRLGKWAKPFYIVAALFNILLFAILISPFVYPTDAQTFNFVSWHCNYKFTLVEISQACVIFGAITIFGIISWWVIPEEKWMRRELVLKGLESTN